MKYIYAPNNKGSSYLIIIIAVVAVLALSVGGYFLFFNKTGSNSIINLTDRCTSSEKACEIFDNINKLREEKKLSKLKYDNNYCSKIQNFTNDLKEALSKDEKFTVTYDKLRNDSKYEEIIGDYAELEEDLKKDKREKYYFYAGESSKWSTKSENWNKSFKDIFTSDYEIGCVVTSDSKVKGDIDLIGIFLVKLRKVNN